MTTIVGRRCRWCATGLRPVVNRQTKNLSVPRVYACEHCDQACQAPAGRCDRCKGC